jgi:hypothetical protein
MTGWLQKLMRISNPFSRRRFSARGKPKTLKYTAAFALASLVLLNPVWSSSIRNTASSGDSDERLFVSPAGEPFRAPAFSPYPVVDWFIQADTNQDDELTSRELWHDAERFFAQLDVDKNGIIDAREIRRYESELLPEAAGYEPGQITDVALEEESDETKSRAPALPERSGASPYSLIDIPHPLRLADVDLDGRITAAELATSAVRQIVYLDRNLDHKISRDELPLTPAQKQPERRSFF